MKSLRLLSPVVLGALALTVSPISSQAEPDLTPVRQWIEAQSKVNTVSGSFNQERKLRTVKRPLRSSGTFSFKIPGSFRWEVGSPPELIALRKAGGIFGFCARRKSRPSATRRNRWSMRARRMRLRSWRPVSHKISPRFSAILKLRKSARTRLLRSWKSR